MRRSRLDVLLEVIQHKGASECLPGRATSDEACGFEVLPYGRMRESAARWMRTPPPERTYARDVLALGLAEEARLGVNPFRLGFIGSTDTHLGTPGLVEEAAFVGHAAGPVTHRTAIPALPDHVEMNPGGLAVLWAEENSRDALFEAMRRREAYATSGTRPVVRFFAGYDWDEDPCGRDDLVQRGYAEGVPMGGHLRPPGHHRRRPRFVVWASQDAGTPDRPGTALERIEIVKLWLEGGAVRTRVVTVAGAAAPGAPDPDTCAPAPGGALELCTRWQDDAFDAAAPALYYARVLERPSCRWLAYACQAARVDCDGRVPGELAVCCDPLVPTSVRERAWTSPIWYVPPAQR